MTVKTVAQAIQFKGTQASDLYTMYMDSEAHSAFTGAPASISNEEGGEISAYEGYCSGKLLNLVQGERIVQTWHGTGWPENHQSILILRFAQEGADAYIYMTHAEVPETEAPMIDKGWHEHYWDKMKAHLAANAQHA